MPEKPKPKPQKKSTPQPPDTPLPVQLEEFAKPYALVSLPRQAPRRGSPAGQERFRRDRLTGKLHLRLTVKTTAFVASGVVAMGSDLSSNKTKNPPLIKTAVERDNRLIIPGSSLKGVVRSAYEAITQSCLCKTKADKTKIPDGYRECNQKDNREYNKKDNFCPACQVFGALNWQGLIQFPDAEAVEADFTVGFMPSLKSPSRDFPGYYINGKVAGRKFYYHAIRAVDKGQQQGIAVQQAGGEFVFTTRLRYMNLTKAELGTLLIILGQDKSYPNIALKVGGGKPVGMGTMTVEVTEIEQFGSGRERYSSYQTEPQSLTGEKMRQFMEQSIKDAHNQLVQSRQLQELSQVLQWPTDREPPEGMY
ncbi:MAG TPA: CRISPR-associated protein [Oscillatoriaceae cyanobacterium M33_DOE_052]|uniref:CRISPR-associated protein n=1 Tax=Planktothricoides sp. SpSt-374 TaxID=2282167 RepID=A0A7C3VK23_9CYAN|nr:CRISPR-associated protein [Oscillatoriaceae cyanobacterium M33_DOE_052]